MTYYDNACYDFINSICVSELSRLKAFAHDRTAEASSLIRVLPETAQPSMFEKETYLYVRLFFNLASVLFRSKQTLFNVKRGAAMRKIKVTDAVGETLCHDMTAILPGGFKGVRFSRGHVITDEDIPVLLDMGKQHVFVWNPENDEVHEDDAAFALTSAMCGDNISYTGPVEGKFQILSRIHGLFCINSDALYEINKADDFTVATIPNYSQVNEGSKLAGARIIPLTTSRINVDKAVSAALENSPVLQVLPFIPLKTGIIITGSEIYNGRIEDRFEAILRKKLGKYDAEILNTIICDDDTEMIGSAINTLASAGAELILLTGGMSVDPDDLTPGAIRASGAKVIFQGVPVQPGNMLTVAYLPKTVLIGVPGASMHSEITSLDIFLPRIFAGVNIKRSDATKLGEGGLCLECGKCTYPICPFGK